MLAKLHYHDVNSAERQKQESYEKWKNELKFGDIDVDNVSLNDIPKIEKMNDIKINVHVWEGQSKLTMRYNKANVVAPRTVNVLLVCYQGLRHYCTILNLQRLYNAVDNHNNHNVVRFCEGCCRKFLDCGRKSKEAVQQELDKHYRFCIEGRLQIEALPEEKQYSYKFFSAEESPVVVCYSDIECYITPESKKHCPYAIGIYQTYHEHFNYEYDTATMRTWLGDNCIVNYLKYLDGFVKKARCKS